MDGQASARRCSIGKKVVGYMVNGVVYQSLIYLPDGCQEGHAQGGK